MTGNTWFDDMHALMTEYPDTPDMPTSKRDDENKLPYKVVKGHRSLTISRMTSTSNGANQRMLSPRAPGPIVSDNKYTKYISGTKDVIPLSPTMSLPKETPSITAAPVICRKVSASSNDDAQHDDADFICTSDIPSESCNEGRVLIWLDSADESTIISVHQIEALPTVIDSRTSIDESSKPNTSRTTNGDSRLFHRTNVRS